MRAEKHDVQSKIGIIRGPLMLMVRTVKVMLGEVEKLLELTPSKEK